ncbi:hypothetical protein ABZT03_40465 [Streptomyces sp. NPDC005574]|uniref:hypothetical protein n=1 Tax=Streptomyces sp. NPDC005574 TaxID=3156891 RepID=UPI0033B8D630
MWDVDMAGPEGREPDFTALIAGLAALRESRLQQLPSDRALASAAAVSPTTIGCWLRGERFPQEIGQLLTVVRAVRGQAGGLAREPVVAALLDEQQWRRAYRAEARRLADGTSAAVRAGQGRAVLERMRPGRPLAEVTDPFAFDLEVHRAIDSPAAGLPELPAYVEREHDRALAEVVTLAAAGSSRIAVLVGGSSTGKTRALWEALRLLRKQDGPWRLWHPIDPTRPDGVLAQLTDVTPHTVIWLNEAQEYLAPEPLGEQVAAGLRDLLRDPERAPALVLATLWPDHWDALTTRSMPDRHSQSRELLNGHKIKLPDAFTPADLTALAEIAGRDPRLGEAAKNAQDGQITQYLAGVPVLLDRYQDASPAIRSLIDAAMDARRLGSGLRIPLAWLAEATPGYLTEAEWDQTSDDWLEQALIYVTRPCNGIPGILTRVRTGSPRNQRTCHAGIGQPTQTEQGPLYRLADYLDQHSRRHRAEIIPPLGFWTAAATHGHPTDLKRLGDAAWNCGLYRDAAQLHKHATAHGHPQAAVPLIRGLHAIHPTDLRPAQWAATHVAFDDPDATAWLLDNLQRMGADEQAAALATRAIAHVALDNPGAVAGLLSSLREAGVDGQLAALLSRNPATHVALDDPDAVARLLDGLRKAGAGVGADGQLAALLSRNPATHVALHDPYRVAMLLDGLRKAGAGVGADGQLAALLSRNPATHVALHDPYRVAMLLDSLQRAGAEEQVAALATRAVAHVALDDPDAVTMLLVNLRSMGADEQVAALATRAVAHVAIGDPYAVTMLLSSLQRAGVKEQVTALLARNPAQNVAPYDLHGVAMLLDSLREAGAEEQVAALATRAVVHVAADDPYAVATLLDCLREAGREEQVSALLARNPARHVAADDPDSVAMLLDSLREAGAEEQVAALLARNPAAHAALDDPYMVTMLMDSLWGVGAEEQVAALVARNPAGHVTLDAPFKVTMLLDSLREAEANEQVAALATRVAVHGDLDDAHGVSTLLDSLREAGANEQVAALLARNPAAHVALNDPDGVVRLLESLQRVGADEQAAALATRTAAHIALGSPYVVTLLLDSMREVGATEQVAALVTRLPAMGFFAQFIEVSDDKEQFRFGLESNGDIASSWSWEDLE